MAKEDVKELPERIPAKKRQVEALLDIHIARWLDSDIPTPSERRRLAEEKARRKSLRPAAKLALAVGPEGLTPQQISAIVDVVRELRPTEITHPFIPRKLHGALMSVSREEGQDIKVTLIRDQKDVIKEASIVVATPKETQEPERKVADVWAAIRFAKNRNVPVRAIFPDGHE